MRHSPSLTCLTFPLPLPALPLRKACICLTLPLPCGRKEGTVVPVPSFTFPSPLYCQHWGGEAMCMPCHPFSLPVPGGGCLPVCLYQEDVCLHVPAFPVCPCSPLCRLPLLLFLPFPPTFPHRRGMGEGDETTWNSWERPYLPVFPGPALAYLYASPCACPTAAVIGACRHGFPTIYPHPTTFPLPLLYSFLVTLPPTLPPPSPTDTLHALPVHLIPCLDD